MMNDKYVMLLSCYKNVLEKFRQIYRAYMKMKKNPSLVFGSLFKNIYGGNQYYNIVIIFTCLKMMSFLE